MSQVSREDLKARWRELSDLPAEQHAAYLENLQQQDQALAGELRSLLEADARSGDFLERGFAPTLPRRFGPWQPIRELGRGGMGQVFHAVRVVGDFEQQAAIKTLRQDLVTPEAARRFHRERHILARLDHPHIARLLDGGEDEHGQPYLAMEYVEGQSIDRWAEGKSLREKLEVFAQVCLALSYAHQHLVVHCDLKPSNIFVNAAGQVKLLDFGIARLLSPDSEAATAPHLTPQFASPEQVRNQPLTTASDIYSLGVVLYKLLTGQLPYSAATTRATDPLALLRDICENPPLELGAGFPKDLAAIVSKAMRKEAQQRYANAFAFHRDIQNFLAGKSVEARPLSAATEFGRFLSRHRWLSAVSGLGLLALLGLTTWALWERHRAQALLVEAREMSGSLIWEVERALRLESPIEARRILLERTGQHLNRLALSSAQDRSLAIDIAESYRLLGDALGEKADQKALAYYRRGLAILEPWRGQAVADFVRAKILIEFAREKEVEEALRILEEIRRNPGVISSGRWAHVASMAHEYRGVLFVSSGDNVRGLAEWQLGLELGKESLRSGENRNASSLVARMHRRLGALRVQAKDYGPAVEHYRASSEIEEAAYRASPGQANATNLATSLSETAFALRAMNRLEEALATADRALALRRDLQKKDPQSQYLRFALSNSLSMKADILFRQGLKEAAGPLIEEAVAVAAPMKDGGLQHAQVISHLAAWEMQRPGRKNYARAIAAKALATLDALKAQGKLPAYKQGLYTVLQEQAR